LVRDPEVLIDVEVRSGSPEPVHPDDGPSRAHQGKPGLGDPGLHGHPSLIQLSLVQLALAGAAGFTVSHFFTNLGIAFPWAAIIAILVATVLGVLTGFPALRVRGVNLVIVTLAAAVAIEAFWFNNSSWGGGVNGSLVPAPSLFGWSFGPNAAFHGLDGGEPSPLFGWLTLVVTVVAALLVANLRRSSLGQEMLAVRANERAAAATGINVRNVKLIGFAIAASIAGASGVLLAYNYGSITAASYDTTIALALVAFVYITGITSVPGGIFGGIIYTGGLFAYGLLDWFGIQGNWLSLAVGILVVASLIGKPEGGATFLFYGRRKGTTARPFGKLLGDGSKQHRGDRHAPVEAAPDHTSPGRAELGSSLAITRCSTSGSVGPGGLPKRPRK
jgi:ABC-type branched-subunit amino acid transport system permease subunit